jgi:hypothetical protein
MNRFLALEVFEDLEEAYEMVKYNLIDFQIKANLKDAYFKLADENKTQLLVLKTAINKKDGYELVTFISRYQNLNGISLFPIFTMDEILKTLERHIDKTLSISFNLKKSRGNTFRIIKNLELSKESLNIDDSDFNEYSHDFEFISTELTVEACVLKFYHSSDQHRKWRYVFDIFNETLGHQIFMLWDKNILIPLLKLKKLEKTEEIVQFIDSKYKNKILKFLVRKIKWFDSCDESSKDKKKVYYNINEIYEIEYLKSEATNL